MFTDIYSTVQYSNIQMFTDIYSTVQYSNIQMFPAVSWKRWGQLAKLGSTKDLGPISTVLYCIILHCTKLHCIALHFTVLYCRALYYTVLQ